MDPRRVLSEKEEILYQTRKHWAVFLKAAIYLFLAMFIVSKYPAFRDYVTTTIGDIQKGSSRQAPAGQAAPGPGKQNSQPHDDVLDYVIKGVKHTITGLSYIAATVLGLLGLARLLSFFSNKVIITGKRVVQHDVLSGSLSSVDIAHIESVQACTGILGSVLGYGKVVMVTGSGQKVAVANLRRPHEFERELFAAK